VSCVCYTDVIRTGVATLAQQPTWGILCHPHVLIAEDAVPSRGGCGCELQQHSVHRSCQSVHIVHSLYKFLLCCHEDNGSNPNCLCFPDERDENRTITVEAIPTMNLEMNSARDEHKRSPASISNISSNTAHTHTALRRHTLTYTSSSATQITLGGLRSATASIPSCIPAVTAVGG